ncbi:hypothetical protein GCM10011487_12640 [Steroidobacter agaridevorans]|uniref:HEPN AbiU2-like domain-containing protein n=2 Tax=Steroidobacter agaridevorans TaxID=2695856 RepID=A0A829Y7L6_9GAMM|nr:hypothetical protein GCM10011487_12640 [Steroidobacter agaridevorans]
MQPLIEDKRIIDPLNQTFAANALNALTWTLFARASIDVLKATIDGMDGSASLAAAFDLLLKHPEALQRLREKRTAPTFVSYDVPELTPEQNRKLEEEHAREESARAEKEFAVDWSDAQRLFDEFRKDEVVVRLKAARNKLIAHSDTILDGDQYRARNPSDFGLKWGDAAYVTNLAAPILKKLMSGLFGIGIAIDEVPSMFGRYADDFWHHLRTGLEVNGGGPDKPVRPRRHT